MFSENRNGFEIVVKREKDGTFTVFCAAVPNCVGNGNNIDEAIDSITQQLTGAIASQIKDTLRNNLSEGQQIASYNTDVHLAEEDLSLPNIFNNFPNNYN